MALGATSEFMRADMAWDAILGLGSNVGQKASNIEAAIEALCRDGDIRLVKRSRNYRTEPWGVLDQDWFVNAAVAVATQLPPAGLLRRCLHVEEVLGRVRTQRWGPRKIDIDILIYRDMVIETPELSLPHPRLQERSFVLVPLAELVPDLEIRGRAIKDWLAEIDHAGVVSVDGEQI